MLQKSKVAGLRIFRENMKRQTIADSNNLNHVTEVACEFNVRRWDPSHLYTKTAPVARRIFDHQCKTTFATISAKRLLQHNRPETVAPTGRVRVRYRRPICRADLLPSRQKLTHSVTSRPPITALRKDYSITSSAVESNFGGMSTPSAFAVRALITNSNLVGCWIGKSAGIAPPRMFPR